MPFGNSALICSGLNGGNEGLMLWKYGIEVTLGKCERFQISGH